MILWQFIVMISVMVVGVALIPLSVERAVAVRWRTITTMFDRALMHGGSLDTLSKALREASEASQTTAAEAKELAHGAVDAVALLKTRVDKLEDHPLLRRPGGNGR